MDTVLRRAVFTFIELLRSSWLQVHELAEVVPRRDTSEFLSDWAQSSWEMLVEAAVAASSGETIYLQPYGEGADCNEVGSRVWRPGVVSTHAVHIVSSSGSDLQDVLTKSTFKLPHGSIPLEQFVTPSEDGWYRPEPPFSHVLIYLDEIEKVVPVVDIEFFLKEVARGE